MFVPGKAFLGLGNLELLVALKYIKLTWVIDPETSRKETKVRLWGHEHWQTRHSSKEAEEEIKKSYELFHV